MLEQAGSRTLIGKIETRIFTVVFFCRFVIGASGFEFGHKAAKVDTSAVDVDIGVPEFSAVMVIAMNDAFVF